MLKLKDTKNYHLLSIYIQTILKFKIYKDIVTSI